jgi:hypothetical protein
MSLSITLLSSLDNPDNECLGVDDGVSFDASYIFSTVSGTITLESGCYSILPSTTGYGVVVIPMTITTP